MSKKKQRIKNLVGIYNYLNHPTKGASKRAESITYSKDGILQVMETVKHLLKEDGIMPMNPNSKVE